MFEYYFLNYTNENSTDQNYLVPSPHWIDLIRSQSPSLSRKSQEMTAMDFFSLDFFLRERDQPWFYRGTDDTIFNFRRLPSFISELEKEYDPLTDRIVRGDCVIYKKSPIYLQGGSGFLCSRAAARLIASYLDLFLEMWTMAEDTTFGPFLDVIGIGVRNSCSGAFMGHGAATLSIRTKNDPKRVMTPCPPMNLSRWPIPRHLEKLMDLLVYHKKDNPGRTLQMTLKRADLVFSAHESVRWFTEDNFWPRVCALDLAERSEVSSMK
jgi:hypothetical protein